MSPQTPSFRNANAALAEGLRADKDISLAAVEVLHSFTSLLVPISVAALPNSQRLVASLDAVVDRGYDVLTQAVEVPYERVATALDRLGRASA
jgi:hypothetical protein